MNVHKNARLTPIGRERIVRLVAGGQTLQPSRITRATTATSCPRPRLSLSGGTGLWRVAMSISSFGAAWSRSESWTYSAASTEKPCSERPSGAGFRTTSRGETT
jgi:hypothetical protein